MGLAGRKQKQRIPADPRNLSWADDASRFGLSYLSKFGWDTSKGLGSSGDGIKSHLKVSQKLDMMGIGAQHQRDPNGIAWKQNQEFEALLKRLNEGVEGEEGTVGGDEDEEMEGGSLRTDGEKGDPALVVRETDQTPDSRDQQSNEKKRKRKAVDNADSGEQRKKKRQEERKKTDFDPSENIMADTLDRKGASPPWEAVPEQPKSKARRPMAHRARIQAAKRLATKSATAISEILGIAPTPTPSSSSTSVLASSSASTAPTPGSLTPLDPTPSLSLEKLTTSSKSVADYFKDKLASKSSPSTSGSEFATPGLGHVARTTIVAHVDAATDNYADMHTDMPRRGLGSLRLLTTQPPSGDNQPSAAPGLGSARHSDFVLTSFLKTPATTYTPVPLAQIPASLHTPISRGRTDGEGEGESAEEGGKAEAAGGGGEGAQ
ncbi:hypothetical protein PAXRUDRAFT_26955 [Paxillus rubicundulus Ve08.2h10]|uniref:PinX1-related protein 1 n=1 Tax=Paxillus rubicundulus Ve08.2h10 TaxID=930991 RepID=A0A0D0E3L5_9AGAM|nr:hypothetical protein PAXRUDRAFT_26955 [Paxillus rubicundulus Ve08.2h10]